MKIREWLKKGDSFWKVIASLITLWLFIFLWTNQWHYAGNGGYRTNRITGVAQVLRNGGWESMKK